ncbi:hypothetical protein CDAR_303731 [Caerostris darwini]|uniref:Uncharacterized protein n=1 Tax=Caerostris darwini TaxID=1538125 RepID=A0AAV4T8L5_9ARAC|nr:hypothetical protein CDAR_303731 [Caerostris darwini]
MRTILSSIKPFHYIYCLFMISLNKTSLQPMKGKFRTIKEKPRSRYRSKSEGTKKPFIGARSTYNSHHHPICTNHMTFTTLDQTCYLDSWCATVPTPYLTLDSR